MTDNEIRKAMGCCANFDDCSECDFEECNAHEIPKSIINLINRQKAEIERLKPFEKKVLKSTLGNLKETISADFVEVVRCKDCKKFIKKGEEFLNNDVFGICEKSRTGFFDDGEEVYGNDFCSYGERKDT